MGLRSKLKRVQKVARAVTKPHTLVTDKLGITGDPRSLFYGDPIEVEPELAGEAIGRQEAPEETVPAAVVETADESRAVQRLNAYEQMSTADRAAVTLLPPLACWNAFVVINPLIGKVQATSLDYMLLKTLNDYPYEGKTFFAEHDQTDPSIAVVTIDSASISPNGIVNGYIAVPFFRFTIASSTLNAQSGGQIAIDIIGKNAQGASINTNAAGLSYQFQRLSTTEAVVGVYIPTKVVATRTLPFLPIAGDAGSTTTEGTTQPVSPESIQITFKGVSASDQVSVTVPGYASAELREISKMYGLPSGDVR